MRQGLLILVSAPSGAGKTSLVKAAIDQDPRLAVAVSHTTRAQRNGEVDGVNYHFTDAQTFQQMIADGAFLEHADVFGNFYGTATHEVQALQDAGHDVILEIDWQGADQVRAQHPEATSIFILPPSRETLRERLTGRGQDAPATIEKRLAKAELEMAQAHKYEHVVVNDDFATARDDMLAVIRAARLRSDRQIAHNAVVRALVKG